MKILVTIYHKPGQGGGEVSTEAFVKELRRLGHKVFVLSTTKGYGEPNYTLKAYAAWPSFLMQQLYLKKKIKEIYKKEKFDIIHASDRLTTIGAIRAAKAIKKPIVTIHRDYWFACPWSTLLDKEGNLVKKWTLRKVITKSLPKYYFWNIYKYYSLKFQRRILNKADLKVPNSTWVKQELERAGITGNITVIPTGREFNIKVQAKTTKTTKVGFFAAALSKYKGIQQLLKAMIPVIKEDKNIHLVITGEGDLQEEIKQEIQKNKLEGNIKCVGKVPYTTMKKLYQEVDIVTVPSLWPEPLSGTIVEGMAAKKVVIATNIGGSPDIIKHGINGYLLEPYDTKGWQETIKMLAKSKALQKKIGDQAYKDHKAFTTKEVAKRLIKEYEQLIL